MSDENGVRDRIKPTVSLNLLKTMLHYESYEEAVEDLKQFGLQFEQLVDSKEVKIDKEMSMRLCIPVANGLRMMQEHQHQERGTKLL